MTDNTADKAPSERMRIDPGEALVDAVVHMFFQPTVIGYEMQSTMNPMGYNAPQIMTPVPKFGVSPLAMTANAIYADRRDEITARIAEGLDVDALADKIADKVTAGLVEAPGYGQRLSPKADEIHRMVRDRVVENMSARAIADYDREQSEMRQAWLREQERARTAPAQIENTAEVGE